MRRSQLLGRQDPRRLSYRQVGALTVAFVFAIVAAAIAIFFAARLMVGDQGRIPRVDWLGAQNNARTTLIQLLGAVGLVGGLVFTARTFVLARRTHRSDRFAKALDQFGNDDSEAVRVGGTYGLLMLAKEAHEYWPPIEEILSARVREVATAGSRLGGDLQAALSVLGQRPEMEVGQRGLPINLRDVDISGASLNGANLSRAYLDGAVMRSTKLVDARLVRARLSGADLNGADLKGTDFTNATLSNATFVGAKMLNAVLFGADISNADFSDVEDFPSEQLAHAIGRPRAVPA